MFTVILFYACDKKSSNYLEQFTNSERLTQHNVMLDDGSSFSRVYDLFLSGSNLIFYDVDNENFFSLLDLRTNTIVAKFGRNGQGPNEIIGMPSSITLLDDSTFCFYSVSKRSLFNVNFSNINKPEVRQNNIFHPDVVSLKVLPENKEKSVAIGLFDKGRYLVLDSTGNELLYYYDYPGINANLKMNNAQKAMAFQGNFERRPTGGRFVFAATSSEIIEILCIDKDGRLKKQFEWHGDLGKYTTSGDGKSSVSAAISRDSKIAFINTCVSKNYIYLLYSGKKMNSDIFSAFKGNTVYVIDWDGNPVKRYDLDIEVTCITVSDDDLTMYAIAELDATSLVKFNLK